MLLHEYKSEENIKLFFNEVYEVYTRMQLSPFFDPNERINIPGFENKVTAAAKRAFTN